MGNIGRNFFGAEELFIASNVSHHFADAVLVFFSLVFLNPKPGSFM